MEEFTDRLDNIYKYNKEAFEISFPTGYTICVFKRHKGLKNYEIYVSEEPLGNTYIKIGLVTNIKKLKEVIFGKNV